MISPNVKYILGVDHTYTNFLINFVVSDSAASSFCSYVTPEMAKEADIWKGLLLDGSDWQGEGERVAVAGWDRTCFHVSIKAESICLLGSILYSWNGFYYQSCAKCGCPITITSMV